jgi:hypothetical protein
VNQRGRWSGFVWRPAVLEIALDRRLEAVQLQQATQAVDRRRVARDHRRGHEPARLDHTTRLGQRGDAVRALVQGVERAEQQHGVETLVLERQLPRVADQRAREPEPGGLLDVPGDRIDQVHLVAARGQRSAWIPAPPPTSAIAAGGAGSRRSSSACVRISSSWPSGPRVRRSGSSPRP